MKVNSLPYMFSMFLVMAAVMTMFFFGYSMKTTQTWINYYSDFLNDINQSRKNTSSFQRSFVPGVVQAADTTSIVSPYQQQPCVLAHLQVVLNSYCACRSCACNQNHFNVIDSLGGRSFYLKSGDRNIFISNKLWLGRFKTDYDSLLDLPTVDSIPDRISSLIIKKPKMGPHELAGHYIIRETLIQEGDSICLFTYLEGDSLIHRDKRNLVLLGGYNSIAKRLIQNREAEQTNFRNYLIILVIASLFILQGVIVFFVVRLRGTESQ